MKCPKCWSNKAYRRETSGLTNAVFSALFVVPMECGQCQHEFCVTKLSPAAKSVAQRPALLKPHFQRSRSAPEARSGTIKL